MLLTFHAEFEVDQARIYLNSTLSKLAVLFFAFVLMISTRKLLLLLWRAYRKQGIPAGAGTQLVASLACFSVGMAATLVEIEHVLWLVRRFGASDPNAIAGGLFDALLPLTIGTLVALVPLLVHYLERRLHRPS